jgi:hypothetical protein
MELNFSEGYIAVVFLFPLNRNRKKHRTAEEKSTNQKKVKTRTTKGNKKEDGMGALAGSLVNSELPRSWTAHRALWEM